ncbi:flagellar hook-associated protein FlgK [Vannielia litorea]|uniref:flagellar hook-associated protein FlgK n=1 Tax=Vannielia litorea TaxID=1217970 RepID=UPI001C96BC1C|nr:flagellar hook-associated protein FlgK [Vannielia litorea]MBY6048843.1 flagellar hook-associated protein FlgK [Vannielia litorea]MBY6076257.1 flagellar hook-associated protein FlgK [Vannielia litorea]
MTLSASMSAALSGLNATKRQTDVISSNIANALTEGYGRRSVSLSVRPLGGVQLGAIERVVNERVIGDRRLAQAAAGEAQTRSDALTRIEALLGAPDDINALTSAYARFEGALIEAASRPDVPARLDSAARAGVNLAAKFESISDGIQDLRLEADQQISREVTKLNSALEQVAELNALIFNSNSSGQDAAALHDQRQVLIDSIAEIVPIRQVQREGGKVALFTPTGGILLEGTAATIGFSSVNMITPDMTLGSGALSGLTLNGNPVRTDGKNAPFAGGSLHALFAQRDEIAVAAQASLDMMARDLVERFQDPALDTTLGTGDAGLFTDGGAAFVATDEEGLSARLEFNILADPDRGGDSWRLRDGLGAAASGPVGNAALLQSLTDRLNESRSSASTAATGLSRSASGHAADFLSGLAAERESGEVELSYQYARYDTLLSTELAGGVDTDRELQQLLVVEQAYAANAKVIQTIDELIQRIMAI